MRVFYWKQILVVFTAETGTLLSPYYPTQYPNNKNCFYLIRQEPGHVITLTFEDFSLEHVPNCHYDYIEVFKDLFSSKLNFENRKLSWLKFSRAQEHSIHPSTELAIYTMYFCL